MDYVVYVLVFILTLIILFMVLGGVAACMLSSKISQREELLEEQDGREGTGRD